MHYHFVSGFNYLRLKPIFGWLGSAGLGANKLNNCIPQSNSRLNRQFVGPVNV